MSKPTKVVKQPDGTVLIERFSPARRIEHIVVMLTFIVLVATGFPQKFYDAAGAAWFLDLLGGLDVARTIHRVAGLLFVAHLGFHILFIIVGVSAHKMRLSLLPTSKDFKDVVDTLRYYLGKTNIPPKYGKFDYRQKFEYLGIVLGGMVMAFSGLALLYPSKVVAFLPGQVIPAARLAHSNEAMLAFLVLTIWHVYGSHFSPEVFPMDKSIFTGFMTEEELKERHFLEYSRVFPEKAKTALQEEQAHLAQAEAGKPKA